MLVRLTDISAKGLEIKDKINLAALNVRMNEGRDNEIIFISEPRCDLKIVKQVNGLSLKGVVKTSYRQPCSRCALELELPLSVPIDLVLKPTDPEQYQKLEDDVGIVTYSGEHIDLEPVIQEYIILATSPYLQPEQDQEGKCLLCGKAASSSADKASSGTVNLGALLKGALKNKQ